VEGVGEREGGGGGDTMKAATAIASREQAAAMSAWTPPIEKPATPTPPNGPARSQRASASASCERHKDTSRDGAQKAREALGKRGKRRAGGAGREKGGTSIVAFPSARRSTTRRSFGPRCPAGLRLVQGSGPGFSFVRSFGLGLGFRPARARISAARRRAGRGARARPAVKGRLQNEGRGALAREGQRRVAPERKRPVSCERRHPRLTRHPGGATPPSSWGGGCAAVGARPVGASRARGSPAPGARAGEEARGQADLCRRDGSRRGHRLSRWVRGRGSLRGAASCAAARAARAAELTRRRGCSSMG